MDLALLVYGISILSALIPTFVAILMIGGFAITIAIMYRLIGLTGESWDSQREKELKDTKRAGADKFIRRLGIVLFVVALLNILIPSERTAYIMVGAYATQKVAENEKVQETGKKVLTLIEQKLDSYIDEGLKEAEKKAKHAVTGGDKK